MRFTAFGSIQNPDEPSHIDAIDASLIRRFKAAALKQAQSQLDMAQHGSSYQEYGLGQEIERLATAAFFSSVMTMSDEKVAKYLSFWSQTSHDSPEEIVEYMEQ